MFQQVKWLDLTHPLRAGIPTWARGACGFSLATQVDYDDCKGSAKFKVQKLELLAGAGTHIDAPAHCHKGGREIHQLALSELISDCAVIRAKNYAKAQTVFSMEDILQYEQAYGPIKKNSFVCFDSGWAVHWSDPDNYHNDYHFPSVGADVAEYLLTKNIAGIGIDTLSPDVPSSGFPVHQLLLGADKYIVENVCCANQLPSAGAVSFALPMMIEHGTEAPLRLIAAIPSS